MVGNLRCPESDRQSDAQVCMERTDSWYWIVERRPDDDTDINCALYLAFGRSPLI